MDIEVTALLFAWWASWNTGDYRWTIPVAAFALVRIHALQKGMANASGHVQAWTVGLVLVTVLPVLIAAAHERRHREGH